MIDWRLIILIACMISFGLAMEKTGADVYLAGFIIGATAHYGPVAVLAGFFIMTVALTQPMSNQAAALVMLPIAAKSAIALGLNPRTFAVAVTYAASCSFLTPLEPACVLVYTPGRYRFFDFVKVGSILTDRCLCDCDLAGSDLLATQTVGFRVSGFRFQVSGSGFQVSGFGFRDPGFRFQILIAASARTEFNLECLGVRKGACPRC